MINARLSFPAVGLKNNSEKLAVLVIWILIAYAIVRSLFAAASKPFWYDEVSTIILARQPTVAAIWRALAHAADGQPPSFYILERAAGALVHNPHIAFRLPSIFSFASALLCVFLFVRQRSGGVYALFCAVILLVTVLYDPYAIEARPYSLLVACIAIALLCYQRAPKAGWLVLMGFSLAAAEALHYYAVFALVPFGLAEMALFLETRRLRPCVWVAFACGLVPLAVDWPLLLAAKRSFGPHIWDPPTLRHIGSTYGWLFHISQYDWRLALAAAAVLALLGAPVALAFRKVRTARVAETLFYEHVLVWALFGLPFVAYAITKLTRGALEPRYVLPAALAVPLGAGYIVPRLNRRIALLLAILLFSLLAVQEARFWASQRGHLGKIVSPAVFAGRLVNLAGHPDLPVVVSDGLDYLPFVYYAPPELARRLVDVVDPPYAVTYIGMDSIDESLIGLRYCYPLRVYNFRVFASEHPSFLLYSSGSVNDWWPHRLSRDGYSLEVVAAEQGRKIYLVTQNGNSP
jgi:4-amino-4-deoxy-L-arabinose transferase-like glycosyltransferase